MTPKFTLPVLFLFLVSLPLIPRALQANDIWRGGSVYSHYALGLPHDYRAPYADAMGVLGVAVHDNWLPSVANPALWSRAILTNASGAFEIHSYEASHRDVQASYTQFRAGPFQMVLPVKRDRIGIAFSVTPLTSSRFITESETVLSVDENHTGEELLYAFQSTGNGGMNRFEAGVGVRITDNLSAGYAPSLLLGVIRRDQIIMFDNLDYRPVNLRESTSHYGFGNRFGLYYTARSFFRETDRFSLGAVVSMPVNLVSSRSLKSRVDFQDVILRSEAEYGTGSVTYPAEGALGFSYSYNPFVMITGDVLFQNWENYTNFNGDPEGFLKNRWRAGLGGQYMAGRKGGSRFFSYFLYRMGVSYDTGSLRFSDNQIETLLLHAGIGIPSSRTNSSIDINAEYGFRGTSSDGLISERIFAVKIAFNLSEIMFIQRRHQ